MNIKFWRSKMRQKENCKGGKNLIICNLFAEKFRRNMDTITFCNSKLNYTKHNMTFFSKNIRKRNTQSSLLPVLSTDQFLINCLLSYNSDSENALNDIKKIFKKSYWATNTVLKLYQNLKFYSAPWPYKWYLIKNSCYINK